MLKLHNRYSICSSIGVTKKLTQQYVSYLRIKKKVGRLAYKFKVPNDCKIYHIFFMAQLEPAPKPVKDLFRYPRLQWSTWYLWKVILISISLSRLNTFLTNT